MTKDTRGVNFYREQLISHINSLNIERPAILLQLIDAYAWSYACGEIENWKPALLADIKKVIELS
jgi:hypothetical protein